jgi:hypothetical protein
MEGLRPFPSATTKKGGPMLTDKMVELTLETWIGLNETLKTCDEEVAQQLLKAETSGKARRQFLLRIHSRLNKLRAQRERQEIINE